MKAAEGRAGRMFVLQLDPADGLPECLERFAAEHGILAAQVVVQTRRSGAVNRGAGSSVAAGVLGLDAEHHPTLTLAGSVDADGEREAVIQEILGVNILRVADPKTGATAIEPSMRPAGTTQAISLQMLESTYAKAPAVPPASTATATSSSVATAPIDLVAVAAAAAAPVATPAPPPARPSGPATVAAFLLNAELN